MRGRNGSIVNRNRPNFESATDRTQRDGSDEPRSRSTLFRDISSDPDDPLLRRALPLKQTMDLSRVHHPLRPVLLKSALDPRIATNHTYDAVFDRRQQIALIPTTIVDLRHAVNGRQSTQVNQCSWRNRPQNSECSVYMNRLFDSTKSTRYCDSHQLTADS